MVNPDSFRGSFSGRERDVLFLNRDDGPGFDESAYGFGLDFADDGRAVAPVDIDGDGDLDLVFQSLQNLRLLLNPLKGTKTNFTRVRLKATSTQHHALGAEVIVHTDTAVQRDYVKITSGFQTQVPFELHFGLGDASKIKRLEVNWPGGQREKFENLPINQLIFIEEAVGRVQVKPLASWNKTLAQMTNKRFDLDLNLKRLDGSSEVLGTPRKIQVINFWAPWCKPCAKELPELVALSKEMPELSFVGVSVEREKLDQVRETITKHKIGYRQFLASDQSLESFFGKDGEAPLPATFVFDENGALARAFFRPVTAKDLRGLVTSLKPAQSDAGMIRRMGERAVTDGYLGKGTDYFQKALEEDPDSALLLIQMGGTLSGQERHETAIKLLLKATQKDPNFPYAWHSLGKAYSRAKNDDAAIRAHRRAVELKPKEPAYLLSLAAVYVRLRKGEEALKLFDKITVIEPHNVLAWLNLGKTRALMGKPGVIEAFDRVLQLVPEHQEAKMLKKQFVNMQPRRTP